MEFDSSTPTNELTRHIPRCYKIRCRAALRHYMEPRRSLPAPKLSVSEPPLDTTRCRRVTATRNRQNKEPDLQRHRGRQPRPGYRARASRRGVIKTVSGRILAAIGILLVAGCGSGLVGPSTAASSTLPVAVCSGEGLAAEDLAGQCRAVPTTMGALEAEGASATATASSAPGAAS